jgi:hypothetical protein
LLILWLRWYKIAIGAHEAYGTYETYGTNGKRRQDHARALARIIHDVG